MFDKTIQNGDITMKFSLTSGDVTLARGSQTEHLKGQAYLDLTYPALDAYLKLQGTVPTP
jgi:hypothetical protein